MNCFLLFCADERNNVSKKNPNQSNSEVTAELGKMWQELPIEKKEYYKNLYKVKETPKKKSRNSAQKQFQFVFKVKTCKKVLNSNQRFLNYTPKENLPRITQEENNRQILPSFNTLLKSLSF